MIGLKWASVTRDFLRTLIPSSHAQNRREPHIYYVTHCNTIPKFLSITYPRLLCLRTPKYTKSYAANSELPHGKTDSKNFRTNLFDNYQLSYRSFCRIFWFRYKLFLGSSLGGKFLNIGDGSGSGEDHCELVGGSELSANTTMMHSSFSVKGMNYALFSSMCFVELTLTSLYSRLCRNIW